ncbi:MAG: class C sortase [Ruminococcus sp.]
MKKKLPIIVITLIFILGVGILSYPLISSAINNFSVRNDASAYMEEAKKLDTSEIEAMLAEAEKYNNSLTSNIILTDPFDEEAYEKIGANYEQTLNTDAKGLIGYVDIPKINVYLPIYHGTSEETLSKGAGHLENTSLPIGGKSTHSVISAHSAFPTETFFDYLTDMQEGDVFYIHVLTQTLKYQVDKISVVLPENTSDLHITRGEDYVTLLTCTPYSVNTHRLLVRGTRVPYSPDEPDGSAVSVLSMGGDGIFFMGYKIPYLIAGLIIGGFILLVVLVVLLIVKRNKRRARKSAEEKPKSESIIGDNKGGD